MNRRGDSPGTVSPALALFSAEPSLFNSLAYAHDEPSGSELTESVDRFAIATYRFPVVSNGGTRLLISFDLRFRVRFDKTPNGQPATTPEALAIDALSVPEVRP